MGVVTTAGEKRNEARDHINEAYKNLMEAIDPDTWVVKNGQRSILQ